MMSAHCWTCGTQIPQWDLEARLTLTYQAWAFDFDEDQWVPHGPGGAQSTFVAFCSDACLCVFLDRSESLRTVTDALAAFGMAPVLPVT